MNADKAPMKAPGDGSSTLRGICRAGYHCYLASALRIYLDTFFELLGDLNKPSRRDTSPGKRTMMGTIVFLERAMDHIG